jgi:hypothetical protein
MPKIGSSAEDKKPNNNLEQNREQLLCGDEHNDSKNASENDGEKQREGSTWRLRDEEKNEAEATPHKSAGAAAEKPDSHRLAHGSNENKISDGWRGGASLRVEGGISWKVMNRAGQPFAASFG